MSSFYAIFALAGPIMAQKLMEQGMEYKAARENSGTILMFGGLIGVEAIVELQGCGVAFASMRPAAFAIFIPALIGRLATGVLTQFRKIGEEYQNLLPVEWKEGNAVQQWCYRGFEAMCIDESFMVTLVGTSVFQHILNAVTFILLTKGRAGSSTDVWRYLSGGMQGTYLSGVSQFLRTIGMRFAFCTSWNWFSTQGKAQLAWVDDAMPAPAALQDDDWRVPGAVK